MKTIYKVLLFITAIGSVVAVVFLITGISIMGSKPSNEDNFELEDIAKNQKQMVPIEKVTDSIPQGTFIYRLYFAEWGGRMPSTPVEVTILGNKITVRKTEETNLSGEDLILESTIRKHKSGAWIITDDEKDIYSDEIGGCSGGGIPIDFETKIIEFC